ncbi:MFS transporter [Streptantibioticus silvisoli]|uniref:MFS transporter n=1 Tax=Streptantibioticus silvisoli TaxID=2705255 RepID=A0ABT6W0D0_9ACTN|nr:MFS transporter [Streptantibioticus silvisoli]MDI5963422.1 MFS transporter [Streptantibioticus silvisoli]
MLRRSAGSRGEGGSAIAWRQVGVTWLAGVQAAVGLGAVSPVSSAVRSSLGLSLGTVAWATSGMTVVGAAFGIPAGRWISRYAARDALVLGLLVIAAAAGGSGLSGSWPALLGSRVLEGAGYLLVFVAGPTVVARLTRGRARTAALAAWGSCVPVGLALATGVGGALAPGPAWHRWLAVTGVGPLLAAGVLTFVLPRLPAPPVTGRSVAGGTLTRSLGPAGAYACLSLVGIAVLVLLPDFLTGVRHTTGAEAGSATALVSLLSALGGLFATWLLGRGVAVKALVPLAVLMPLGCLPAFSSGVPLGAVVGAAGVVLFVDGLLISAVFAVVPDVARRIEDIDLVNGSLSQFGSLGVLLGPPLFGLAVGRAGWEATTALASLFTGATYGLLVLTVRVAASPAPAPPRPTPPAGPDPGPGTGSDRVPDGPRSRGTE